MTGEMTRMTDSLHVIATVHSDFPSKFGIPRQSGLVDALNSTIIFESAYRNPDALRGLDGFSHIWLIWGFSKSAHKEGFATVRPPRLGGNTRMGVFATRSPYRPNPLGLSCVRLDKIEKHESLGTILHIAGADLMDGTPIYDIKPYLPFTDMRPDATGGFASEQYGHALSVVFPDDLLAKIPGAQHAALIGVLEQDPRPSYQEDSERTYGLFYAGLNIRFRVEGHILRVYEVSKIE